MAGMLRIPCFCGCFVLPTLAVEILGTCHLYLLDELRELVLVRIERNSNDFEPLGMKLLIRLLDVRYLRHAWTAPSGLKSNEHHFAFHFGQIDFGAVGRRELHVQSLPQTLVFRRSHLLTGYFFN